MSNACEYITKTLDMDITNEQCVGALLVEFFSVL